MSENLFGTALKSEFEAFLLEHAVNLAMVDIARLFTVLIDYYTLIKIEGCKSEKQEDYLHYESSRGGFYFERVLYIPSEDGAVETLEPETPWRSKVALQLRPSKTFKITAISSVNLWSIEFSNVDAFAAAVRSESSFQEAMKWGEMPFEVSFIELS